MCLNVTWEWMSPISCLQHARQSQKASQAIFFLFSFPRALSGIKLFLIWLMRKRAQPMMGIENKQTNTQYFFVCESSLQSFERGLYWLWWCSVRITMWLSLTISLGSDTFPASIKTTVGYNGLFWWISICVELPADFEYITHKTMC